MRSIFVFALGLGIAAAGNTTPPQKVTFTKHVAPILYNRCVECHRPGEAAPMSLITYKEVRPWAKAIKEKVVARTMPPWLADPAHGEFKNSRRMTEDEINTVVAWVNAGSPEGKPGEMPEPPQFETGWTIGKPDAVLTMPESYPVPASGEVPYQYMIVPTNFTEDKWIEAAEIRPGNRGVVHHVIAFVAKTDKRGLVQRGEIGVGGGWDKLSGYAPGEQAKEFPAGTAKRIPAGAVLVFQLHYTTNGKAATDQSHIGLRFAKAPVTRTVQTGMAINAGFKIPPHADAHEVRSYWTAKEDVRIVDLMPHMHVRGKDFKYIAHYPDGRSEVLLSVPKYDFNWQLLYQPARNLVLPKGTKLECIAHFDNSANNKYNPDPAKEVRWGDQTWEEMMIGWFDYVTERVDGQKSAGAVGGGN